MSDMENISSGEVSSKSVRDISKEKLLLGEYKISNKHGRSVVWNTFGKIEDNNGTEIKGVAACRRCSNVYRYEKSTSNLMKHKCYIMNISKHEIAPEIEYPLEIKKKGIEIMTEWTVTNGRPFSIVDDSGLTKMIEFAIAVGAKYGEQANVKKLLPHPTTISRNISKLYEFHFKEVRNEILLYKNFGYSLTLDIWTDDYFKTSFLSVTMHYIKEGAMINWLLALKCMKGVSCSGVEIKRKVEGVLHEFGCDLQNDNPIIVTERSRNMIAAFSGCNLIHCTSHLINNVIEKTIGEIPDLLNMVNQCSKIVKYLKKSGLNSNLETSLKSYCPTRWNTVYFLLQSIETNWAEISNILMTKNEINMMQEMNLSNLSSIVSLLKPFQTVSELLEGSNYCTLPLIIPNINRLVKECFKDDNDSKIVRKCKIVLRNHLKTIVMENFTKYHNIALFLFPPTNNLSQFSKSEKDQTIADCSEVMKGFVEDSTAENQNLLAPSIAEVDLTYADYARPSQISNVDNKIADEIHRYKNINIAFSNHFNVLQWWKANEDQFPILFKTSQKIYAAPASSAASERIFSLARNLISDKSCQPAANNDMLNEMIFLHENIEHIDKKLLN